MARKVTARRTGAMILSQWTRHVAVVAIHVFLIGYAVGHLGAEHYGAWAVVAAFINYLSTLDSGMTVALQYFIARFAVQEDREASVGIYSTACAIFAGVAVLAAGICVGLSFVFHDVFPKLTPASAEECSVALWWVALAIVGFMASMPVQGTLLGLQQHTARNIVHVLGLVGRVVAVVVLFNVYHPSIVYLGVAFAVMTWLRFLLGLAALRWLAPEIVLRLSSVSWEVLKQLITYSGHSFWWTVASRLTQESGAFLSAWMFGPTMATYMYVGTKLPRAFGGIPMGAAGVFVPVASSLHAEGDTERLRRVLARALRFSAVFSIGGAACLIAFGRPVIEAWLGPGYDVAYTVLCIMSAGFAGMWTFHAVESMLMGVRLLWPITWVWVVRATGTIGLALLGGWLFDFEGMCVGLVAALFLTYLVWIPGLAARHFGVGWPGLYLRSLPAPLVVAAAVGATGFAIQRAIPPPPLWVLLAECVVVAGLFGALAFAIGLDGASRALILRKLQLKQG